VSTGNYPPRDAAGEPLELLAAAADDHRCPNGHATFDPGKCATCSTLEVNPRAELQRIGPATSGGDMVTRLLCLVGLHRWRLMGYGLATHIRCQRCGVWRDQ
jgi:hypothetical protein